MTVSKPTLAFIAIFAAGVSLRLTGLGWGIPAYDAELAAGTEVRATYHPDEDKILWQLERMRPEARDFDPRDFGWGTLETYLVGLALAGVEKAGGLEPNWRTAFREGRSRDLRRIFLVGRALSALFGILTLPVAYRLARDASGDAAALLAMLLLAVSPLHVVNSHFLTPDVPLAFWIAMSLWLLGRSRSALAGLAAGLAFATKPNGLVVLVAFPLAHLRNRPRGWWLAYPAFLIGFLAGEPYALLAPGAWGSAWLDLFRANAGWPQGTGPLAVAAWHLLQVALYGLGPLALLFALRGLARPPWILSGATCALFGSLVLTWIPMVRYDVPLLPLLAVAAALGLAGAPLGRLVAALMVLPPALFSLAQVGVLLGPHPAQAASTWMRQSVPPGSTVAQLWYDYPVLDRTRYRVSLFEYPFVPEGRPYRPLDAEFVIVDDLPIAPFRPEIETDLRGHYTLAARFAQPPRLGPWVLPEPSKAHDWKYTHPEIRIFKKTRPDG